jgi:PAS domain S-box-containing protein
MGGMGIWRGLARRWRDGLCLIACLGWSATALHAASPVTDVRIGVLAFREPAATLAQWAPTQAQLQAVLPGYRIQLSVHNQEQLGQLIAQGALDFVHTQPEHYVLMRAQHGLAAVATQVSRVNGVAATEFGGVVFVRSDNTRIHRLADVAGQRVAATIPTGLGAYRMQQWELFKLGIRLPQDVSELILTGQPQEQTIEAVLNARADVGFARTGLIESMVAAGRLAPDALRVLPPTRPTPFPVAVSTALYPEWPFSATRRASGEVIKAVTLALLSLEPTTEAARVGGYVGFVPPADYTPLEVMLLRLGAHPHATPEPDWREFVRRHPVEVAVVLALTLLGALLVAGWMAHQSRRQSELRRQRDHLLESLGEGVYGIDAQGLCTFINPAAAHMLGFAIDDVVGRDAHALFHHRRPDGTQYPAHECPAHLTLQDAVMRETHDHFVRKDGSTFAVRMMVNPIQRNGVVSGAVVVFNDITERQRQEAELRVAATALQTQEGICITDERGRIVRVNAAFSAITGYEPQDVVGHTPAMLSSGRHAQEFYRAMWRRLLEHGSWQGEVWNRRKSGEVYPEWLTITAVRDDAGAVSNYVGTFLDITQRKQAEARIEALAFYDPLTELGNRRLCQQRLVELVDRVRRRDACAAVLFIDLETLCWWRWQHGCVGCRGTTNTSHVRVVTNSSS